MAAQKSPRPTLAQALAVFIAGAVITVFSVGRAMASFASVETEVSLVPIIALGVGASLFAAGGLMTLVVVVRPFFERRASDDAADEIAASRRTTLK